MSTRAIQPQKYFFAIIAILVLGLSLTTLTTEAAPNQEMNYQGKLTDTSGAAVSDGSYNMRFYLYDAEGVATTSAIWTEVLTGTDRVTVTNGLFSVMLGSTTPLTSVDFNQTLYLGVEIGGSGGSPSWDGEMSPRKVLGAVPAAFESLALGGATSTQYLRSDQPDTMASSSASTLLTITQSGVGDILNLFDGSNEVFSVIDGGNVGIGSTSPNSRLSVSGDGYFGGDLTATGTLAVLGTGTSTFSGDISIEDTKGIMFSDPDSNGIFVYQNQAAFGNNDLIFTVDRSPTEYVNLAFPATASFSANSGLDGLGNFMPSLSLNDSGSVQLTNTTQGTAGNRYFEVNMTDGMRVLTGESGFGTSTPGYTVTIDGSTLLTGAFYDNSYSSGSNGYILQTTGSGVTWVATSSLGFPASLFTDSGDITYLTSLIDTFMLGTTTLPSYATNTRLVVQGGAVFTPSFTSVGSITDGTSGAVELDNTRGITISGDYAYVTAYNDDGVQVLDISDPSDPIGIGSITDGANGAVELDAALGIVVSGNYAYVAASNDDGVQVLDISDPTNPIGVGSITDGANGADRLNGAQYIAISGNYAYVTAFVDHGVQVLDISDPTNPVGVGSIADNINGATVLNSARDIAISGNYAYVTSPTDDGVQVIDISDPTNPVGVGSIIDGTNGATVLNNPSGITISGNYAYVAASLDDGVQVLDISDPTNPVGVGSIVHGTKGADSLDAAQRMVISGKYAYVTSNADPASGVQILDISSSTNPIGVGSVTDGEDGANSLYYAEGIAISGNYVYVTGAVDDAVQVLYLGGISAPNAEIGTILADQVDIKQLLQAESGIFRNSLNVGGNAAIGGALTITGTASSSLQSANTNPALTVLSGYVGFGTSTPSHLLTVAGDMLLTGGLYDSTYATGTNGMVLLTTGSGTVWTATSSLGLAASLALDDLTDVDATGAAYGTLLQYNGSSWATTSTSSLGISSTNTTGPTLIVAASDSLDTSRADYVADGTNDEVEIQQAIDALPTGGGTVLLLEGTYNVGTTTYTDRSINMATGTALLGSGHATVIRLNNNHGSGLSIIQADNLDSIHISNLQLDGNRDNGNDVGIFYGIEFSGVSSSTISDIYAHDTDDQQIRISGGSNNIITQNITSGGQYGILLISSANNNIISNNIARSHLSNGIHLSGSDYNTVTGNNTYENIDSGIAAINGSDGNAVVGNVFTNNGIAGSEESFVINNSDNNLVANNSITATSTNALIEIISSGSENNHIANNVYSNQSLNDSTYITDGGTGTRYDDHNRRTLTTNTEVAYSIFNLNASSSSSTAEIIQRGTGDIFNLYNSSSEVFTVTNAGNVGIGTTTPWKQFSVAGDMSLTGGLYDSAASAGSNGMVLQTTGSGVTWVATSSLGLSSSLALNDLTDVDTAGAAYGTLLQYNGSSWATTSTSSLGISSTNTTGPTLIVAASDSLDTSRADYVADGTDDQVTIEQALTALPASGGTVLLLEGTFSINDEINITQASTTLFGSGAATILAITATSTNWDIIDVANTDHVYIGDLAIDGSAAAGGIQNGIRFSTTTYSAIEQVVVNGMRNTGIYLLLNSDHNVISGNTLTGQTNWAGVALEDADDNIVSENVISGNLYGIVVDTGSDNILVGNQVVDQNVGGGSGIWITDNADQTTIVGNNISNSDFGGITIDSGSDRMNITGNTIASNLPNGITLDTITGGIISNNTFYHNGGGTNASILLSVADDISITGNSITATGSAALISVSDSASDRTYIANNTYSNSSLTDATYVSDSGTGTRYDQYNRTTLTTNTEVGYNLLSIIGSSTAALASSTQLGTGDIFTLSNSSSEVFTVLNNGNVGIGTSTPFRALSVGTGLLYVGGTGTSTFANNLEVLGALRVGNASLYLDTDSIENLSGALGLQTIGGTIQLGASGASSLTLDYARSATSTIVDNNAFAWTLATGTNATPIIRVDTSGTGAEGSATTSINGSLLVGGGALTHDDGSGVTSIDNLSLGSLSFETDAGIVQWIDMPVETTSSGLVRSYSALLDGDDVLTIYGETDGLGGVTNTGVGIATTTPTALLSLQDASTTVDTLLNIFNQSGTTLFSVLDTGFVGIGTSTPGYDLTVDGDLLLTGGLRDSMYATGTNGMVLLSTGSGTVWTATSSLGITASLALDELTDVSTAGQVYGSLLMYTGSSWATTSTSSIGIVSGAFTTSGGVTSLVNASDSVGIGTSTPTARLTVSNGGISAENIILGSSDTSILSSNFGFGGYTNFSGGIGTGGVDSAISALRLTSDGNLVNIGSIRAGEVNVTTGGTFAAKVDYTTGNSAYSVGIGDLDGDGMADLAVSNYDDSDVSIFINNGDGTFATKVDYGTDFFPASIVVEDLNGDGMADLITANDGADSVSVLLNNGDGTFATKVDYGTGGFPASVDAKDLNGDGMADLAIANVNDNTVSVLLNNGDGTFATKVDYGTGTFASAVAIGDLDGDGMADLAVTNRDDHTVSVLLNNGDGTFATKVDYGTGGQPYSIAVADLNDDDVTDIAVGNSSASSNTVSVLLNNGDGTFATKVDYGTGNVPRGVAVGDFNGDGVTDLALANKNDDTVSVLLNNGDGTFATKVDYGTGFDPLGVAIGDLNGDGKADIAAANSNGVSDSVSVLINTPTPTLFASGLTGNVGIGTSTPGYDLTVAGDMLLTGGLRDSTYATGTNGMVLQTTGSGVTWVATSSLGFGSSLFTDGGDITYLTSLTDTLAIGTTTLPSYATNTALAVHGGGAVFTPGNPVKVGGADTADLANDIVIADNYAYVVSNSTGDDLEIFDVSDPTNPVKVGGAAAATSAYSIEVVGNYAYVASNSTGDDLEVFDVSDPTAPVKIGGLESTDLNPYGMTISGNHLYIADNGTEDFDVIDISDPTNPVQVGGSALGSSGTDVVIMGGYAYVTSFFANDDLEIFDISDPTNPLKIGGLETGTNDANSVAVSGNYAYLLSSVSGDDLEVIDISDPASPSIVGGADVADAANDIEVIGNYAYVVSDSTGDDLEIFDISSSTNPVKVAGVGATTTVNAIAVSGNYAYVVSDSTTDGLEIFDLGGITAPTAEIGTLLSNRIDTDVANVAQLLSAGSLNVGSNALIGGALTIVGTASSSLQSGNTNPSLLIESGHVGIGTSSPNAKLTVAGEPGQTTSLFEIASSSGDILFQVAADGSVDINSGAFYYDAVLNKTSIERLDLGAVKFEDDAGYLSWIDMTVTASATAGTIEAYTAQIDTNEVLTLYSEADGSGGLQDIKVIVGTSTSAFKGSSNLPDNSLIVNNGALCVDNGGENCDDASRTAGIIYSTAASVTSIDVAENYPTKDSDLGPGDLVMLDMENPVFVTKYERPNASSTGSTTDAIVGVISTQPGLLLGGFGSEEYTNETKVPVTLTGRVPVKVNFEGGDIYPGDRIAPSNVPGVGMKATTSGTVAGIALETYIATSSSASTTEGTVLVFIDNDHYTPTHQFAIDGDGNVAFGTSTDPNYRVKVAGDIAATGFINISASSTKRDIAHIDEEEQGQLMDAIRGAQLATYNYLDEATSSPRRLGLIAEEAPSEVLSVDGKGVDLYKLSALTLAGVQSVDARLLAVEERLSPLLATSTATAGGQTLWDRIVALAQSFVDGVLTLTGLKTDSLCVGEVCVDEATFLKMVESAGGTVASPSGNAGGNTGGSGGGGGTGTTMPPTDTGTTTPPSDTGSSTPPLDTTAPSISINGDNPVELMVGDSYSDAGASASDDVDGDLTINIVTSNNVDTSTAGTYSVTYEVWDNAGNTTSESRTVSVSELELVVEEPQPEEEVVDGGGSGEGV